MNRFTKLILVGAMSLVSTIGWAAIPKNFEVAPAPGATVEEISTISITYDSYYEFYASTSTGTFTIDGTSYGKNDISYKWTNYETTIEITLNTPVTAAGEHTIVFPDGYFYDDYDDTFGEFNWTVTIEGNTDTPAVPEASIDPKLTVSPENGATVSELSEITVTYTVGYEIYCSFMSKTFTINDKEYSYKNGDYDVDFEGKNDEIAIIVLTTPITTAGQYTLTFPAGYFYDDYSFNSKECKWTVNVEGGGTDTPPAVEVPDPVIPKNFSVSPENGTVLPLIETFSVTYNSYYDYYAGFYSQTFNINDKAYSYKNGDYTFGWSSNDSEFIVTLTTPITTPGLYTITFPDGYFYDDWDETFGEISWTLVVDGDDTPDEEGIPAGFTVTPAEGFAVESLTKVIISSKGYTGFTATENVSLTVGDGEQATTAAVSGTDKNVLTLTLTTPVTTTGEYKVVVPAGAFSYLSGEETKTSAKFTFTVNVAGAANEFTPIETVGVTVDPEQGVYAALQSFRLMFHSSYFPETNANYPIYLKNEVTGENVAQLKGVDGTAVYDIYLNLPEVLTEEGHYILDIPEGAIYDYNDTDYPAMQFRYWISKEGDVVIEEENVYTTPANGSTVAQIEDIVITFPDMTEVFSNGPSQKDITVKCGGEAVDAKFSFSISGVDQSDIKMIFNPALTEDGDYEISFPAQVFNLGVTQFETRWSNAFTLTYKVDSSLKVEDVDVEGTSEAEIFTVEGIRVKEMQPGRIYIVVKDGKASKVMNK